MKSSNCTNTGNQVTLSQAYTDIKGALGKLAETLKAGIAHVYDVLTMQQVINSISYIGIVLILGACGHILIRLAIVLRKARIKKDGFPVDWDDTAAIAPLIVGILCGMASIIFLCVTLPDILMGFLNPEYGAIKEVLHIRK